MALRLGACVVATAAHAAALTIAPSPAITFGTWVGWGVSIAWWGQTPLSQRDDVARLQWSMDDAVPVRLKDGTDVSVPALGLSVARYNAGASSWNTLAGGRAMVASPNIPRWKQIPSFWLDPSNDDPSSSAWNWTADAGQIAAATRAVALGASLELFSNSPPWFLCANDNPSGAADGNDDNIRADAHGQHALYMAVTAAQLCARHGLCAKTVEAFNEPSGGWSASGTQEGCHFAHETQGDVLQYVRPAMHKAGSDAMVAATDESIIAQAIATWSALNASSRRALDEWNVHGYGYTSDPQWRDVVYQQAVVQGGKALRMSEFGDGDGTGANMAACLALDMARLHPTSWVYWQSFDVADGWAMMPADLAVDAAALRGVNPKLFILAQWSRHVRPGALMLFAGDATNATTAALDVARGVLALVTTNAGGGADLEVTYDLSAFATVPAGQTLDRWTTLAASGGDKYAHSSLPGPAAGSKSFAATVPAGSVSTIEVRVA